MVFIRLHDHARIADDLSTFSQIKCDSLDISADGNVSSDNMSSSMESTVHSVGTSEECEIESLHSGACTPLFSQYEDDEDEVCPHSMCAVFMVSVMMLCILL